MVKVGDGQKTIGREVVFLKGVDQVQSNNTLAKVLALILAVYLLMATGWAYGSRTERLVTTAQAKVIQEYRTLDANQRFIIGAGRAQVASMTAEVKRLKKALKKAQAKPVVKAVKPAPKVRTVSAVTANGWRTAQASWYGSQFYGRHTASGLHYGAKTWCVAHKSLPFGTMLEVRYAGHTVRVSVQDRGPFVSGRDLDLSAAVAGHLGFTGVHQVAYRIVH